MGKFDGNQAGYAESARRNVPGLAGLHRMTGLLLAERVPANGRVLVVGAGGGLELNALAEHYPGWSFDGVDLSTNMLILARETAARAADRIRFLLFAFWSSITPHLTNAQQRSVVSANVCTRDHPSCLPISASPSTNRTARSGLTDTSTLAR